MFLDEVLALGLADRTAHVQPGQDRCLAIAGMGLGQGGLPDPVRQALGLTREETAGALVGELVFSADLLTSLDKLCPRSRPQADWHAALPRLPAQATTPDLLDLSRRLGEDAGRRLVRESGGCLSVSFREAYKDSRENFDELIERWQQIAP